MRNTIKAHKDFIMSDFNPICKTDLFLVRAKDARFIGDARYGLVATKRTFKLAVHRNRAKRLLRDWIAFNESLMLDTCDYVFIARHNILEANRENGRKTMAFALKQIEKQYAKKSSV